MEKTEQHPITPPPELRRQWQSESPFRVISVEREDYMIDNLSSPPSKSIWATVLRAKKALKIVNQTLKYFI